jgi:hypothetical protein
MIYPCHASTESISFYADWKQNDLRLDRTGGTAPRGGLGSGPGETSGKKECHYAMSLAQAVPYGAVLE